MPSEVEIQHLTLRHALRVGAILVFSFLVFWYAWEFLLLTFAALLLSLFLISITDWILEHTRLSRNWSYFVVLAGLLCAIGVAIWQLGPQVSTQIDQLGKDLPRSLNNIRSYLESTGWGREILGEIPVVAATVQHWFTGKISQILNAFISFVYFLIVGIYFAANPGLYVRGILRVAPPEKRARTAEVLREVDYTLRWWIWGQFVPMVVLGVATMIGLWMLDVPLAFTLGAFTGVMIFIPYVGAWLSAIPALLIALTQSPGKMLYVAAFYLAVHLAEGYLLTPFVQRRAVRLPPALTLISQFLLGLVAGFLGLALATPLAAAGLVLVQMLYLQQLPEHHGES